MTEKRLKEKRPLQETYYYPVLFMIAVTVVFISVLAYLNDSTREVIERNNAAKLQESILYVLDIPHGESAEDIVRTFEAAVEETGFGYRAKETRDLALFFTGNGLWGKIDGYLAVSEDLKTLRGVTFTEHSETPGLGGRIDERPYQEQFRGLSLEGGSDAFIVYRPDPAGNVDAISGATSTSYAVARILDRSIRESLETLKGVGLDGEK